MPDGAFARAWLESTGIEEDSPAPSGVSGVLGLDTGRLKPSCGDSFFLRDAIE
jgi:hypothetical protein